MATPTEPGTPRRPGRPRDATRDKAILTAALDLLQQRGYRDLTIESVAEQAGVGRPTIYRRWPSKPALVVAALARSTRLAVPPVDTGSLRRDLIALQRHRLELMSTPASRRVTAGLIGDLAADPELAARVDLDAVFDLDATVRHVDAAFERLHALAAKEEPVNV